MSIVYVFNLQRETILINYRLILFLGAIADESLSVIIWE
jgi:hypothetical protein